MYLKKKRRFKSIKLIDVNKLSNLKEKNDDKEKDAKTIKKMIKIYVDLNIWIKF